MSEQLMIKGGLWFLSALLVKKMVELRQNKNEQEQEAFKQWDAQKEVTVEELGAILEKRFQVEINENIEEYLDCGEFFVRDRIECDNPLTSNIHKNKLVFQQVITDSKIIKVNARMNRRRINNPAMEEREFIPTDQSFVSVFELKSMKNQGHQHIPYTCYVEDAQSAKIGKVVQFLGRTKQEILVSEDQFQFASIQVNLDNSLKTTTKTERGIKVGEVVTVLGKVLFNPKQRAIKIISPSHILTSKKELKSFYSSFNMVNAGLGFFSVCSSVLLYKLIAAIQKQ